MSRDRTHHPHDLDIQCACTDFGMHMIRIAAWAESFFRHEGADYRCINCRDGVRALLVPRLLLPPRIRFRRI